MDEQQPLPDWILARVILASGGVASVMVPFNSATQQAMAFLRNTTDEGEDTWYGLTEMRDGFPLYREITERDA